MDFGRYSLNTKVKSIKFKVITMMHILNLKKVNKFNNIFYKDRFGMRKEILFKITFYCIFVLIQKHTNVNKSANVLYK